MAGARRSRSSSPSGKSSRRSRTVSTDLSKKMKDAAKKEFRINLVPDFSDEHLIPEDKIEEAWKIYAPGKDRMNYPDFRGACFYCKLHSREEDLQNIFATVDINDEREIDFRKFNIAIQQQNQKDYRRLRKLQQQQVVSEISDGMRHPAHRFLLYVEPQKQKWECSGQKLVGGCLRGDHKITSVKVPCYASRREPSFKLCDKCFEDKSRDGGVKFDPKDALIQVQSMLEGSLKDDPIFAKLTSVDQIMEATFKKFDSDRSGCIDFEEFRAAWCWLGVDTSDSELKKTFEFIDADMSGEIDLDEYRLAFKQDVVKLDMEEEAEEDEEENSRGEINGGVIDVLDDVEEEPTISTMKDFQMTMRDYESVRSTFHTLYSLDMLAGGMQEDFMPKVREPQIGESIQFRLDSGAWIDATIVEQIGDMTVAINAASFTQDIAVHWNDSRIMLKDDGNQIALALRMWDELASLESIADALGLDGSSPANQLQVQIFVKFQKNKDKEKTMQNEELRREFLQTHQYVTSDAEEFLSDVEDGYNDMLGGSAIPDSGRTLQVGSVVLAQPNPATPMVWEKMRIVHSRNIVSPDDENERIDEIYLLSMDWEPGYGVDAYRHMEEERKRKKKLLDMKKQSESRLSIFSLSSWGGGSNSKDPLGNNIQKKEGIVKINPLTKKFNVKASKNRFPAPSLKLRKGSQRIRPIPLERLKFDAELWLQDQARIKMYIPFENLTKQFPDIERDDLLQIYEPHRMEFQDFLPTGDAATKWRQAHERAVTAVASAENGLLVSGSYDRTIRLWRRVDTKNGPAKAMPFPRPLTCRSGVLDCDITRDGSWIAAATFGRACEIWSTRDARRVHTINTCWQCPAVAFHPTGTRVAVSNGNGDVVLRLWDLHVELPAVSILGFEYGVFDLKIHKFGDLLLTASKGQKTDKATIFDLRARKPITQQRSQLYMLNAVTWQSEMDMGYSILDKDRLRLYDLRNDSEPLFDYRFKLNKFRSKSTEQPKHNYTKTFVSSKEHMAIGFLNGQIDIINIQELSSTEDYEASLTDTRPSKRHLHSAAVTSLAFQGNSLFSGSMDKTTNFLEDAVLDLEEANEATIEI